MQLRFRCIRHPQGGSCGSGGIAEVRRAGNGSVLIADVKVSPSGSERDLGNNGGVGPGIMIFCMPARSFLLPIALKPPSLSSFEVCPFLRKR